MSDEIELVEGDKILICSDGLTEMVPNKQINDILVRQIPVGDKCEELICEALNNGGRDNVSVILIEVQETVEIQEESTSTGSSLGIIAVFIMALIFAVCISLFGFVVLKYTIKNINSAHVPAAYETTVEESKEKPQKSEDEYVNTVYIIPEETFDLSAIITAAEIQKDAVFTSENPDIASVDDKGVLKGETVGKTVIVIEDKAKIYKINVEVLQGGVSRGKVPVSERLSDILHKLSEDD
jgi:hypothetical protein